MRMLRRLVALVMGHGREPSPPLVKSRRRSADDGFMPAPRVCRSCGARLPADVRWCLQCLSPVTEFTAREPLHAQETHIESRRPLRRTSRWIASPTQFGPFGRIAISVLFAAGVPLGVVSSGTAFWPVGLWFMLGYSVLASLVLHDVWRPTAIPDTTDIDVHAQSARERFASRHPALGFRIHLPRALRVVLALIGTAWFVIVAWAHGGELQHFFIVVTGIGLSAGVCFASWLDL